MNLKPISRVGDKYTCPCKYSGERVIVTGEPHYLDERKIATVGSKLSCGSVISSGSSFAAIDGKPIATIGSATACGGTVITGSNQGKA